jgi:predicted PurR-regulated permease PerM
MLAATIVVVAGLRAAAPVLLPVLIAVFLTVLIAPSVLWIERGGTRPGFAVAGAVVALVTTFFVFGALLTTSIRGFNEALPTYQEALGLHWEGLRALSGRLPFDIVRGAAFDELEPAIVLGFMSTLVTGTLAALSNTVLVLLTVVFMLLEVAGVPRKLRMAMDDPQASLAVWAGAVREVQRYLAIKTVASLLTGTLIGVWLWILGVDFPLMWGIVAFLLNYVPNVGSIVAAIPGILIAIVQPDLGAGTVVLVAAGYFAVNMAIGNLLEPQWMGRRLGISPLVVFLSLVFWGFVWGPVGMLLSVPLTMVVKIAFEQWDETHWLVVLLGPAPKPEPRSTPVPIPVEASESFEPDGPQSVEP